MSELCVWGSGSYALTLSILHAGWLRLWMMIRVSSSTSNSFIPSTSPSSSSYPSFSRPPFRGPHFMLARIINLLTDGVRFQKVTRYTYPKKIVIHIPCISSSSACQPKSIFCVNLFCSAKEHNSFSTCKCVVSHLMSQFVPQSKNLRENVSFTTDDHALYLEEKGIYNIKKCIQNAVDFNVPPAAQGGWTKLS